MRLRTVTLACLGAIAPGCGPSLTAQTLWVQWFSYREVADMAVTSDGEAVLVGHSTNDERYTGAPYGQGTWRPWVARVASDSTRVDSWTGFLGSAKAVAVDDEGRAYVSFQGLRDDQDWSAPTRCELRALDTDGSTRWTQRWDEEPSVTAACPGDLVVAADAVIVKVHEHLEAYELDGRLRWQLERPPSASPLSVHGEEIWLAYQHREDDQVSPRAWQIDAREGRPTEIELDLDGVRPIMLEATNDRLLVMGVSELDPSPNFSDGVLASLTLDGQRRWVDTELGPAPSPAPPTGWRPVGMWAVPDGDDLWVIGSERMIGEQSIGRDRYRMMVQRRAADGEREGTIRRSFVEAHQGRPAEADPAEADPAELARAQCPASDALRGPQFGSRARAAAVLRDGSLLVAGAQGCRDSFLLHLEVQR